MPPLTPLQRSQVLFEELVTSGITSPKKLAKMAGCDLSTARRRLKRLRATGSLERLPGAGRPKKIKGRDRTRLHQLGVKNPLKSNAKLAKKLEEAGGPSASSWTVGRALKEVGLDRKRPRRGPILGPKVKATRLAWCQANRDRDWSRVVFSDEAAFQSQANIQRMLTRRGTTPRLGRSKFAPKIMVWGGISLHGTTPLCIVNGTINAERYVGILEGYLFPTIKALFEDNCVLQQDNAPAHAARTTEFLAASRVQVLEWPSNSPDLNPIENLWGWMKGKLADHSWSSIEDFKVVVDQIWNSIDHDYLKSLIESMPRRIEQCIAAKGGYTDY